MSFSSCAQASANANMPSHPVRFASREVICAGNMIRVKYLSTEHSPWLSLYVLSCFAILMVTLYL